MRVLWFSVTPSLYSKNPLYNGGGWIASLEGELKKNKSIELGVAFEFCDDKFKVCENGVTYYPINVWKTKKKLRRREWNILNEEKYIIPECIKIIEDFSPDIIHIFGTEWCFGLIQNYIKIPVIIHLQGSIIAYNRVTFPPGYSVYDKIRDVFFNLKKQIKLCLDRKNTKVRARREERIFSISKNFMGRTNWDLGLSKIYSPNSNYYRCEEMLRPIFYQEPNSWNNFYNGGKLILTTVGGVDLRKGITANLATAKILKEKMNLDFEWRVIGNKGNIKIAEKNERIRHEYICVRLCGVLDAEEIKQMLLDSHLYVYPSLMDNSPNALCEAQLLGVPCIATYVGGFPSLVTDFEDGLLVPSNDPESLAFCICNLMNDSALAQKLSINGKSRASKRHNPQQIINTLFSIYESLLLDNK